MAYATAFNPDLVKLRIVEYEMLISVLPWRWIAMRRADNWTCVSLESSACV